MNSDTMTVLVRIAERPVRWVAWKCGWCGLHLGDYNAFEPCHLKKDCPRCKRSNELDRRKGDAS